MNFLRNVFQRTISSVRAIGRHFRRPRQIPEAEAEVPEPFQLLKLPELVRQKILGHMSPADLFLLSFSSERFQMEMKIFKYPIFFFELEIDEEDVERNRIAIQNGSRTTRLSIEHIDSSRLRQNCETVVGKINGETMELRRYGTMVNFRVENFTTSLMEKYWKFLLGFFKPYYYDLTFKVSPTIFNLSFWRITNLWYFMNVECSHLLTYENLQFILNTFDTEILIFNYPEEIVQQNLQSVDRLRAAFLEGPKTARMGSLAVKYVDIMELDDILNCKMKNVYFSKQVNPLSLQEVNIFLKEWQKGEKLTDLQNFYMSVYDRSDEYFPPIYDYLEGVDLYSERPSHPEFFFYSCLFDNFGHFGGMTMKRRTDGVLATLFIDEDSFDLIVWTDDREDWQRGNRRIVEEHYFR